MSKQTGCKNCKHDHWDGGDRVCNIRPHDYQTNEQRAIVEWLFRTEHPFTAPGCPGFEYYLDGAKANIYMGEDRAWSDYLRDADLETGEEP